MYEARQNKEKVSRRINEGSMTRQRMNMKDDSRDHVVQKVRNDFLIQRIEASELTREKIGKAARTDSFSLYSWNGGEFISEKNEQEYIDHIHFHCYHEPVVLENGLEIEGHAVWMKGRKPEDKGKRNLQKLKIKANKYGEHWDTSSVFNDIQLDLPNETSHKESLYANVIEFLPDIVGMVLNDEIQLDSDE